LIGRRRREERAGVIALQRGDVDGAERTIREALAAKPTVRLAHYNLALIAEKRGDLPCEREYVQELKEHPESFKRRSISGSCTSRLEIGKARSSAEDLHCQQTRSSRRYFSREGLR